MLIVAVSMTSSEKSELINDFEFNIPKQPIINNMIAGNRIIVSNSFIDFFYTNLLRPPLATLVNLL